MTSIEITGAKAYDYQYLVTAYIALLKLDDPNLSVVVEKIGGEDAEISLCENGVQKIIELQVKSDKGDLGQEKLVDWLCHFGDNQADENLTSILIKDTSRFALFVTAARCLDNTRLFITDESTDEHVISPVKQTNVKDFVGCYEKSVEPNQTRLVVARTEMCNLQSKELGRNRGELLKQIAKRILVWEQTTECELKSKVYSLLNSKYFIPSSMTAQVLINLIESVREARNTRSDVVPSIRETVSKFRASRAFNEKFHIDRNETAQLLDTLTQQNALLITGMSFCGKTHLSKHIGQEFQNQGYHWKMTSEVSQAERFLINDSMDDRICLLDDPFGDMDTTEQNRLWNRVRNLIQGIASNCKLIVTSRKDIIRALRGGDVYEWSIDGHRWYDLSVEDSTLVQRIWSLLCDSLTIPKSIRQIVLEGLQIQPKDELLQPGQLRHLAYRSIEELEGKSFEELCDIARVDVQEMTRMLKTHGKEETRLYATLGLGMTTIIPIQLCDAGFIISNAVERPSRGKPDRGFRSASLGGKRKVTEFPIYKEIYETEVVIDGISQLFDRGYLVLDENNVRFSHPTYQEAFRAVFLSQNKLAIRRFEDLLDRGMSCLAPQTATLFAKNLSIICNRFQSDTFMRGKLIDYAVSSLSSIFPPVRDKVLPFLLGLFEALSSEQKKIVIRTLKRKNEDQNIYWHNGSPWIDTDEEIDIWNFWDMRMSKLPEEQVLEISRKLLGDQYLTNVPIEHVWEVVTCRAFFDEREQNVSLLKRLMTYNESLIREKAAFWLMEYYAESDSNIIQLIFQDDHPHVIYQGIRGCFSGWKYYSERTRNLLLMRMKMALGQLPIAIASYRFLLDFGDEFGSDHIEWKGLYNTEKVDLWNLWSELFPILIGHFPLEFVEIKEGDLYTTLKESKRFLAPIQCVRMAEAWYGWIDRYLLKELPDTYGLALVGFLLSSTAMQPEVRKDISAKLLRHKDSNFITVNLAKYVEAWDLLTEIEREEILQILVSGRVDVRWLRAVAMTREYVPESIQKLLTGSATILASSAGDILSVIPDDLLRDCLHVYCGYPQPLWCLGVNHKPNTPWKRVIIELLHKHDHLAFPIALREVMGAAVSGSFGEGECLLDQWPILCSTNDTALREQLFKQLLVQTVAVRDKEVEHYWNIFFETLSSQDAEEFSNRIVDVIEAFALPHDPIFEIFGRRVFFELLLPKLPIDRKVLELRVRIQRVSDDDLKRELLAELEQVFENTTPRLGLCYEVAINLFQKCTLDQAKEIVTRLEEKREILFEIERGLRTTLDDEFPIEDWCSIRRIGVEG